VWTLIPLMTEPGTEWEERKATGIKTERCEEGAWPLYVYPYDKATKVSKAAYIIQNNFFIKNFKKIQLHLPLA
jgi:hypothetical protein